MAAWTGRNAKILEQRWSLTGVANTGGMDDVVDPD